MILMGMLNLYGIEFDILYYLLVHNSSSDQNISIQFLLQYERIIITGNTIKQSSLLTTAENPHEKRKMDSHVIHFL